MNDAAILDTYQRLFPEDGEPVVRAVGISSADGAAELDGRSAALGGAEDARLLSYLRRSADVILVGAATAETEGYTYPLVEPEDAEWRASQGLPEQPPVALVSRRSEPAALQSLKPGASAAPRVFVSDADAADSFAVDAVASLQRSGAWRILVEGGPHVWANLLQHRALDEFSLTISPVFNPGGRRLTEQLDGVTELQVLGQAGVGKFVVIRYAVL